LQTSRTIKGDHTKTVGVRQVRVFQMSV